MPPPVTHKGTFPTPHSDLSGTNLHQPFPYVQDTDPGAVGAGTWWFDTSTNILKVRNDTDTGWESHTVGVTGAPTAAKYIVQEAHADLSAEQSLGLLTTGLLKNTVAAGVGVLSTAVAADLPAHTHALADITGDDPYAYTVTLGPWYAFNVAGTATTTMLLKYLSGSTTVSSTATTIRAGRVGEIVGMILVANDARVSGTAILKPTIGGSPSSFASDSVVLDGSTTTQMTQFVTPGGGVAIASGGNQLGCQIVTSGFTPAASVEMIAWMVVRYLTF
jgi:hypothetical protein